MLDFHPLSVDFAMLQVRYRVYNEVEQAEITCTIDLLSYEGWCKAKREVFYKDWPFHVQWITRNVEPASRILEENYNPPEALDGLDV